MKDEKGKAVAREAPLPSNSYALHECARVPELEDPRAADGITDWIGGWKNRMG
jgi:hypothetical protein